jgi:hypothetical protein
MVMGSAMHLKVVFLAASPKASTTIFGHLFSAATDITGTCCHQRKLSNTSKLSADSHYVIA